MTGRHFLRIMLADDHAFVRSGIRRFLEQDSRFSVVAEAETGERAYQLYGEHLPDVCIIDLSMPGLGGMEAIRKIVARYTKATILVLSMHDNAAFCYQALNAGAKGYLAKNSLAEELVDAIDTVIKGQIYVSSDIGRKIAAQRLDSNSHPMIQLSVREFEIFRMLAEGLDIYEIASSLSISSKTVANYQTIIREKLDISSPVGLVRLAIRFGIIET